MILEVRHVHTELALGEIALRVGPDVAVSIDPDAFEQVLGRIESSKLSDR